ncbi:putative propeptide PepSY amd peptidase M4 [Bacillus clarus]|uniref:Putative propeptide PepSY amd peptidase M4 n=1 Tax=Bacillus clarus TaxID=2338372 RepID=A0A090YIH5_9BACI|nr:putative propeptide PepSY amd peptidase M4 [Bacillus clarus]
MMNQKDKERQEQVAHIIKIPDEYQLVVDDDQTVDEPLHVLWWEHKADEEKWIQISLNRHTGNLLELDVCDEDYFPLANQEMDEEKAKEIASEFIKKHLPTKYDLYTYVYVEEWRDSKKVRYLQEVNGYPLPHTGCAVRIHPSGNVVAFHHDGGVKEKPLWPECIVDKEVVLANLKDRQDMRLVFINISPDLLEYESGEVIHGYRLVYEPEPSQTFIDASTGEDLFGPEHYRLAPTVAVTKPEKDRQQIENIFDLLDWDEEKFVKVAESEDGYEIRMKFVPKEELQEELEKKDTYLMDDFCEKHLPMLKYDNLVGIGVEKSTNKLLRYMKWSPDKEEKIILSREQCLYKALQFLEQVIPDATEYLRLLDDYDEEDSPGRFCFTDM